MDHIDIGMHESRQATLDSDWLRFARKCEQVCADYIGTDFNGRPDFDRDQSVDGYSLDWLVDQFDAGASVADILDHVKRIAS